MFNLTYEFKLKPTQKQIAIFEEWLETHRRVYNHALAERKDWYRSRSCQVNACSLRSCSGKVGMLGAGSTKLKLWEQW